MLKHYQSFALRYPTTEQGLKALVEKPTWEPVPQEWRPQAIQALKPDKWGNEYRYLYPGKHNGPAKPDVWSIGPDGKDGTRDDVGNWD